MAEFNKLQSRIWEKANFIGGENKEIEQNENIGTFLLDKIRVLEIFVFLCNTSFEETKKTNKQLLRWGKWSNCCWTVLLPGRK